MIQWYPGHMAKAFREMDEIVRFVDMVIVLLDARIPKSSFNPEVYKKFQNKPILYVLTKNDKADPKQTIKWIQYYQQTNALAIAVNSKTSNAKTEVMKAVLKVMEPKRKKDALKGIRPKAIKAMVVGIPNVGKSTLINNLAGKKIALVGDKPGVTKSQQWIKLNKDLELLDTPGVLWPKFEEPEVGFHLAITGAIKDNILQIEDVCNYAIKFLIKHYPNTLFNRYEVEETDDYLTTLAKAKKLYTNTKEIDFNKTSFMILNDLRNGALGQITLDWCKDE